VLPGAELCDSGHDENCDRTQMTAGGTGDPNEDGDAWTMCQGDCCDNESQCLNPGIVNPGAVEFIGDSVDNDCNGSVDEARTGCLTGEKLNNTVIAMDLLKAMDICQIHDPAKNNWGIVGTPSITRASGTGDVNYRQVGVMTRFGTSTTNNPIFGSNFAVLSSGRARDAGDADATTTYTYEYANGNPPSDFVSAHGGSLPVTKTGCPAGSGANDSVMLKVQLKVPTNANSFSFDFRFFSQEYWAFTCTEYNDFFITMLDTTWTPVNPGDKPIPADKNISFDSSGNYISVNSNQFFTVCDAKSGYTCPDGTGPLAGTGYNLKVCVEEDIWGNCEEEKYNSGATKWLTTTAPVKPGETITLRFVIWDTSDMALDSLVLIDNFRWNAEPSGGAVTFACWDLNKNGTCDVASEDISGDNACDERDCKQ
ncbi:MAG TPA: choice-of-anchor L domain-containing protein, partial [bacterium]|nr:choice-of-anchor L domain-containing protein [bacterium]